MGDKEFGRLARAGNDAVELTNTNRPCRKLYLSTRKASYF